MPTAVRTEKERFCTDRDAAIVCLNVDPIIALSEKEPAGDPLASRVAARTTTHPGEQLIHRDDLSTGVVPIGDK
jgi:hypothetical protein